MSKTKSIRAVIEDAKEIEQIARELAVKFERQVNVSEVVSALMRHSDDAINYLYEKEVKSI